MTSTSRFTVPERTKSDFGGGNIFWSLFHDVASLVHDSRPIDVLDFGSAVHLKPYAVALAIAIAKRLGTPALRIEPPADATARSHLIRLGVPSVFDVDWGNAELRATNIPLKIVTDRPSPDFSFRTAEMLAAEFLGGLSAGTIARIADSIDEVVLNALAHSESPIGCVVAGQAFPSNHCIEVAIVDFGITIRGHLSRRFSQLTTDEAAIHEAVREGVTGTLPGHVNRLGDPNSGVGLSELRSFVEAIGGELAILSGTSLVCFGTGCTTQSLKGYPFPGTLVNVRFETSPAAAR
jgi:hypothetical protein